MVACCCVVLRGGRVRLHASLYHGVGRRASMAPIMDLFITLLSMGQSGWLVRPCLSRCVCLVLSVAVYLYLRLSGGVTAQVFTCLLSSDSVV